jgi:membrane-anchored protein YejM (alkaline phosphatase superfamily)
MSGVHETSFLFITLDSCRFDVFEAADTPNMDRVGQLNRTWAPGNFTFSSHAAMFMGFTPGDGGRREPFVNPKYGKVFKMAGGGLAGPADPFVLLDGRNIIEGLKSAGYSAVGTGAVGWFSPRTPTGRVLTSDFDEFRFWGGASLTKQLAFLRGEVARRGDRPIFVFLNLAETHVPYYFEGAPWDPEHNPCVPFGESNDRDECWRRQRESLEYVDRAIGSLLEDFSHANTIICSDHGDAWGEDGLWEHGIHHEKVLEVPLILRLQHAPPRTSAAAGSARRSLIGRIRRRVLGR